MAGVTWPGTKVALELWGDMQLLEEMLSEAQREGALWLSFHSPVSCQCLSLVDPSQSQLLKECGNFSLQ